MSDNKKLIYFTIAGVAAVAIIGVGLYLASAEDEYEGAKNEIAKMGDIVVINSAELGGQVVELDQFIKLMSIIKTEQLRKRAEQLKAEDKSIDYPEENRRKLYRKGDWDAYESSIIENWEADEKLFKEAIDVVAEMAGISN